MFFPRRDHPRLIRSSVHHPSTTTHDDASAGCAVTPVHPRTEAPEKAGRQRARCCVPSFSYFSSSSALDILPRRLSPFWRRRYWVRRYREYNTHPVLYPGGFTECNTSPPSALALVYVSKLILISYSIFCS